MHNLSILTIGDIHMKPSAIFDLKYLKEAVMGVFAEQRIDLIVLLGDLFNDFEKMHVETWNKTIEFLQFLKELSPVKLLLGNHDLSAASAYQTDSHWLDSIRKLGICDVIQEIKKETIAGHELVFAGYHPAGKLLPEYQKIHSKSIKAMFTHQEFHGVNMGAIKSIHGDLWPDDYPMVFNGHIHDHHLSQCNILNVGTPRFTGFGETGQRCVVVANVGETVSYKRIGVSMPRKYTMKIEANSVKDVIIDHPASSVRILIEDSKENIEFVKKSKHISKLKENQNLKIVFRVKSATPPKTSSQNLKYEAILADKAKEVGLSDFLDGVLNDLSAVDKLQAT